MNTDANARVSQRPLMSIIVPCFNEEAVIGRFFETVTAELDALDADWEIICVDDGSRDNTLYIDGQLHGYNPGSLQELVIICIYEELVTQEFAPPQELPISTTRVHVI